MDYMILTEYLIYAAIIVVGIFILLLIKRKTRLPNHNELNNRLRAYLNTLEQFLKNEREHPSNGYDFFRKITKFIYTTDRLAYTTNLLAARNEDMFFVVSFCRNYCFRSDGKSVDNNFISITTMIIQ